MLITPRTTCRDCGSPLDTVLNLGDLAVSTFPAPGDSTPLRAPLRLVQCQQATCGLVQLADTVSAARLFVDQYWYRSGINETMVAELASVVEQATRYVPIGRGSVVVDIGANDGTLLQQYGPAGTRPYRVAVEPSLTFTADLESVADVVHACFFPNADLVADYAGKVRCVTAIACLYDLDDPHAFIEGIQRILAPDGIWIVQVQDLAQMLAATAFDTICHEHLTYLSLRAVERLIQPHGLQVVHAERRAINGGSLRLIIGHATGRHLVSHTVSELRQAEDGCHDWERLAKFSWRVGEAAGKVHDLLHRWSRLGAAVDLYGASTKANTLLQVASLGPNLVRQAWERSQPKWGRATVTGIPIVSEEDGREYPPHALLLGIWQFREAVIQREAAYLASGGILVVPLPAIDVVKGAAA